MARSLRSRKPPHKYPVEEYELETKARRIPKKSSTEAKEDELEPRSEATETVKSLERSKAIKGNLNAGRGTSMGIRTAVLRDRTNIPGDPLKVDLLLKQGTGVGNAKRSAKTARTTAESAGNEKPKITGVTTRKKLRKVETRDESSPVVDSPGNPVTAVSNKENTANKVDPTSNKATAKKSTKSASKKFEASELSEKETAKKPSSKIIRKPSRKIISKKEPSSSASVAEPMESRVEKSPAPDVAIDGATTNAKKPARSTRRAPKSVESTTKNEGNGVATTDSKKITSREVSDERDTSVDSGLGTRDLPEQDKVPETIGVATSKKLRLASKRATSKRTLQVKKLDGSIVVSLSRRSAAIPGKKFFKSKATDAVVRIVSPVKRRAVNARRRNIGARGNPRISVSFRSRQTTLDESFAKQAPRKVLRPRVAARNYCEDTMVASKRASKSGAEEATRRDVPVYKALEPQENSANDRNEIYEFRFDSNDSREKLPPKRRRKVVATKRAKDQTGPKKKLPKGARPRAGPRSDDAKTTRSNNIENAPDVQSGSGVPTRPREPKIVSSPMEVDQGSSEPAEEPSPEVTPPVQQAPGQISGVPAARPVIVESVELRGNDRVNLTTTPILAKTSEPKPRHALQPSKQFRTMLNHALLNKSLSPITKAIENFDPGSPWRPPTFAAQQFSRVKNMVQSTPQVRNFSALPETTAARNNPDAVANAERSARVAQIADKRSPGKATGIAEAPRKFGTVISNINKASNTVTKVLEKNNKGDQEGRDGRFATEKIKPGAIERRIAFTSDQTTPSGPEDRIDVINCNDYYSDKENSFPSHPSPKRSPLKSLDNSVLDKSPLKDRNRSPLKSLNRSPPKSLNTSPLKSLDRSPLKSLNTSPLKSLDRSPLKSLNRPPFKSLKGSSPVKVVSQIATKGKSNTENSEPQAGPSSAQSSLPPNESRILRQSNLDNFLNLDEMPRSTRISTAHGIFDDAHSTPINGRAVRKVGKASDLENAFGFDDNDDSDTAISPIGKPFTDLQVAKRTLAVRPENARGQTSPPAKPARLSIGDIKKHILPMLKKERVKEQPIIERVEEEEKENREGKQKKAAVEKEPKDDNPPHFVDTFDVIDEKAASSESSVKELPLFTDLEPPHFKRAPRYSYKRKRFVGFVLSDDDASNDEDNEDSPTAGHHHVAKKRKISKVEMERQKQMDNWAKDLNQTFDEIDHFDLVVE